MESYWLKRATSRVPTSVPYSNRWPVREQLVNRARKSATLIPDGSSGAIEILIDSSKQNSRITPAFFLMEGRSVISIPFLPPLSILIISKIEYRVAAAISRSFFGVFRHAFVISFGAKFEVVSEKGISFKRRKEKP